MNSIELFAGAGGMAIASSRAGFKHILLNEIDKNACATLRMNRPEWKVVEDNIDNIIEDAKKYKGKIDLISGGFPCQSFSYAGKGKGLEDARGTLFFSYANYIKNVKPRAFLIENVKGLVSHDNGETFKVIIKVMEQIGYHLKWKILNSAYYGVGQKRQRIIIVGFKNKKDFLKYKWPKQNKNMTVLKDVLKDVPKSEGYEYSENKRKILALVPPGGCWRDLPDDIAKKYMKKSYFLGGGRTGIARRISWDEPSLTLTTSPMQKQTERCHPDETRPFTIREYARIQSFPDNWKFAGSLNSKYRQIGNAVPVLMLEKVFKNIYDALK